MKANGWEDDGAAVDRYPFAHDAGVDTVARRRWPPRRRLEAFLNDQSFEMFGVGVSLAHGDRLAGLGMTLNQNFDFTCNHTYMVTIPVGPGTSGFFRG